MSDVIKLLPDSVANQIAAGEVVQRPASVVKELVENAVDAGAQTIDVVLIDSGKTLIQIVDDGCGMSDTDARLAFERHSTSKIRKADDLFTLHTMGFRGEALASICAVAQVEMKTQRKEDEVGTQIIINGSVCEKQEPCYYSNTGGTNLMVKNLFYNIPARRKFLKSNSVEYSNIYKEFERLALVNSSKSLRLISDGVTKLQLPGGSFKQRIVSLYGKNFEQQLLPLQIDTDLVSLDGFVCRPENARKRNPLQFLFVNGRFMRHPYFHKAIMSCYEKLISSDAQPNYFINFTVDPATIDVNIHPTKTEVKFENEQTIWPILSSAVRESLGRFSLSPTIDFDTEGAPEIPVFDNTSNTTVPTMGVDTNYNPFEATAGDGNRSQRQGKTQIERSRVFGGEWQQMYDTFMQENQPTSDTVSSTLDMSNIDFGGNEATIVSEAEVQDSKMLMQFKGRYILSQVRSGLMFIDQHRAHIRILYDRLMKSFNIDNAPTQQLLFPESLHLTSAQSAILDELQDDLGGVGLSISFLGNNDWSVNGVPLGLDKLNVKDLITELVDSVINGGDTVRATIRDHICRKVATKAAIPYGKALSQEEMEMLHNDLMQLDSPNYDPEGKTIIQIFSTEEINKRF